MEQLKNFLFELDDVIIGEVIARPSKKVKTPYVADVKIISGSNDDEHEYEEECYVLAHAPSLGCGGLVTPGSIVIMSTNNDPKICTHIIHVSLFNEREKSIPIGVHPKNAELMVNYCLYNNHISSLQNLKEIEREKVFQDSRFDFTCIDENGIKTIIEVKNVPLADYEDIYSKDRKKRNYDHCDINDKISYFPDGYRKKQSDTVSPRALKHIKTLEDIKIKRGHDVRCILIFVIQRTDSKWFQPSIVDPIYREAFGKAVINGVEIIPISIKWKLDGRCYFEKEMICNYP